MSLKNFKNKWSRLPIAFRILFAITVVWYTVSLIVFTKPILSVLIGLFKASVGIEPFLGTLILIILYIHLFILILYGLVLLFTKKYKRFMVLLVLSLLYSPILNFATFYVGKTYNIIEGVQKKYVEYTSVMISLNDTTEYKKIGMISAKEDPTGYVIPLDMIKENKIDGTIVEYDDYISMMVDLYDGKIDALFTDNSYDITFASYEKFHNIKNETKVVYQKTKKLENVDNVSYSTKNLTEPFTLLLTGVDSTGDTISKGASFNGDTLMLITFNPKTLNATVFSIPRDTFVPIACSQNRENKINASAYGGTSCVVKTIENLTGIKIDYYVKINFTGVVKLVDDLGGINVDVPIKFCEQDSQRRFGEYEICLDKGYQKLNGEEALALARHRHSLPLGDFQRVQHQQLVVEAMVQELKNISSVDDFYKILEDVANNIDTNMSTSQILSLYGVGKNILLNSKDDLNFSIQKTYLTGYDLTMYVPSFRSYVYTFQYYRKSLEDIVEAMKVNLEITSPKPIKTFSFSANEEYTTPVIGKTYYKEKRRELLPNFIGKTQSEVEAWALEHELNIEFIEENSTSPKGQVINQSVHAGSLVDTITSLTITVSNNESTTEEPPTPEDPDEPDTPTKETLPDFTGYTINEFNKWKNNLKDVNLTIETIELSPEDLLTLDTTDLEDNKIYKQSSPKGTEIESISTLKVYYYKKPIEPQPEEE